MKHSDSVGLQGKWVRLEMPDGMVFLVSSSGIVERVNGRKIKPRKSIDGHWFYGKYAVHHLVALAFIGAPPKDGKRYELHHKDDNKDHNYYTNLEYLDRIEHRKARKGKPIHQWNATKYRQNNEIS